MFRSESILYYKLIIPRSNCWHVMNELGYLGCVHIKDLSEDKIMADRPFFESLRYCDETLEVIKKMSNYLNENGHEINKCQDYKVYLKNLKEIVSRSGRDEKKYFESMGEEMRRINRKLEEQVAFYKEIDTRIRVGEELRAGLSIIKQKFSNSFSQHEATRNLAQSSDSIRIKYFAGSILTKDAIRFQRMVYRITRGTALTQLFSYYNEKYEKNSYNANLVDRSVFFIAHQEGTHNIITNKLKKLFEIFEINLIEIPKSDEEYNQKLEELYSDLDNAKNTKLMTGNRIREIVNTLTDSTEAFDVSYIEHARLLTYKEKKIYQNLNKLIDNRDLLRGYFWCPKSEREKLKTSLESLKKEVKNFDGVDIKKIKTSDPRPTRFKLNDFTKPFQQIVDTYGVPRYKEVNPGYFTIITFPFLFGVMFGDIGHGFILFLIGLYLCFNYDSAPKGSLLHSVGQFRYLFALMGFFATYCGLIYNDFLAIMTNLNTTCYNDKFEREEGCAPNFGMDIIWARSSNKISFFNSFKMKLSIILGVTHMTVGIMVKGVNTIYFGEYVEFLFEFIPQITFMVCTFGYMCICIMIKWTTDWSQAQPPSIINLFINLVSKTDPPLWGEGDEQLIFQRKLAMISMICVPLMLIPKPIYLAFCHSSKPKIPSGSNPNQEQESQYSHSVLDESGLYLDIKDDDANSDGEALIEENSDEKSSEPTDLNKDIFKENKSHDDHGEGFGELFIHQMIEVIEFVLGSISNTASYLRLWALSLAHSQLAEVFYGMLVEGYYEKENIFVRVVGISFGFMMLANVTAGVLMGMDLMECFLHALRLHWVEFQNKFYKGDGYVYQAFDFITELEMADEQQDEN